MNVWINDTPHTLPEPATVADALTALNAVPPFAVAVNRVFVPRSAYAAHGLHDDDRIEVIRPVTGG
ncbi:sulfur carrier protein ThiS [Variovorax guangxiensis]|uniref:Sulfur carrier protein ThiS n=1 Tax=Variovorax guangxiensis TaxID=1775474 RepID=A0A502E156_9BURK|nr:sulfur carrier protein ThiS [Variovorax guangxiensis]RZI65677.1 MAG: sulfur carrier protein ThiS [Variovorax sp.]TPG26551.1 sulfur carrier protein ThiS [Variovorax ginsengisoli]TPG30276.1 sulfur carrier protein ThiS [Variovorax guangxiensis]